METVTGFETPEEAALELELPLLGTLPPPEDMEGVAVAPAFPADERARREYHRAADRLLLSPHSRSGSIGLLGDVSSSHRAIVVSRLAASVAAERTAILVDADVRAAHLSFDGRDRAQEGLVDVLRYGVRSPRVVAPTQTPGLNLLPVGSGTVDLEGTFGSDAVHALFEELSRTGDLLLINGPDLLDFRAAASFLAEVDSWILVHEIGVSDSGKTRRLRDTFGREKCVGILAVVAPEPAEAPAAPAVERADAAGAVAAGAAAATAAAASSDSLEIIHGTEQDLAAAEPPPAETPEAPAAAADPPSAGELPAPADGLELAAQDLGIAADELELAGEEPAVTDEPGETVGEEPAAPAEGLDLAAQDLGVPADELELAPASEFIMPDSGATHPAPPAAEEPAREPEAESPEEDRPVEAEAVETAEAADAESAPVAADESARSGPGLLEEPEAPVPAVAVPEAHAPDSLAAPSVSPVSESSEAAAEDLEMGVEATGGGRSRAPIWIGVAVVVVAVVGFFAWRMFGGGAPTDGAEPSPQIARTSPAAGSRTGDPGAEAGAPAEANRPEATSAGSAPGAGADGQPGNEGTPSGPEGSDPGAGGTPSTDTGAAGTAGATASGPTSRETPAEPPAEVSPPVREAPPVERSAPVGTTGPGYGVHVASVKAEAGARREAARYEAAGYPIVLRQKEIPGKGLWWRVYVGPYGSKGDASRTAGEIKKAGITDYTQVHRLPEE